MSNGKAMIIILIAGLLEKAMYKETLHKMSQYFPKPYDKFRGNVKVELDFYNYARKTNLKEAPGSGTSNLTLG